jgi:dipeptide/tripeptide permease
MTASGFHRLLFMQILQNTFFTIREFSLLGLFIIALGTGGIKPCVSAFGGEQFVRPQQDKQLEQFFSVFYFAINAGSLISTFVTPILREDVHCFGSNSCFPLAFGVPALLMIVAVGKCAVVCLTGNCFVCFFFSPQYNSFRNSKENNCRRDMNVFSIVLISYFLRGKMELQDSPS